jgi:hypothetical protein
MCNSEDYKYSCASIFFNKFNYFANCGNFSLGEARLRYPIKGTRRALMYARRSSPSETDRPGHLQHAAASNHADQPNFEIGAGNL